MVVGGGHTGYVTVTYFGKVIQGEPTPPTAAHRLYEIGTRIIFAKYNESIDFIAVS